MTMNWTMNWIKRGSLTVIGWLVASGLIFAAGGAEPEQGATDTAMEEARLGFALWATPADYEGDTGNRIDSWQEAPTLAQEVAAGQLPPLQERMGDEPMVVRPDERIGTYGGTVNTILWRADFIDRLQQHMASGEILQARRSNLSAGAWPGLAKSWETSADATAFTVELRSGFKWSDGAPFTADDVVFNFVDMFGNEELFPVYPGIWKPGGVPVEVDKVDDYTVQFSFARPWATVEYAFSAGTGWGSAWSNSGSYRPAHYLKQFHIEHNADADKLAKEAGFEHWFQLFMARQAWIRNAEIPQMGAWDLENFSPERATFSRNAYFWAVDTAGNQLPYIDRVVAIVSEDEELRAGRLLSGDVDFSCIDVSVDKIGILSQSAAANNYVLDTSLPAWENWHTLEVVMLFNHTVPDPVLRDLFSNVAFKQAMSLAINREEVSELAYLGLAQPTQAIAPANSPVYDENRAQAFAEYDPDRARKLLDGIGLKRNAEGFVLRPDGEVLNVILTISNRLGSHAAAAELIASHWNDIGVKTTVDELTGGGMWQRFNANESHVSLWKIDMSRTDILFTLVNWWAGSQFWGREWKRWFQTDGEHGEKPPAEVREWYELWEAIPVTHDADERVRLAREAYDLRVENLWYVGVVGPPPSVRLRRDTLRNVILKEHTTHLNNGVFAYQWYFDQS